MSQNSFNLLVMKKMILEKAFKSAMPSVKYFITSVLLLIVMSVSAHSNVKEENYNTLSLFSNTLFVVLLIVAILLLIAIAVLADVLKNISTSTMANEKKKDNSKIISAVAVVLLLSTNSSYAQQAFHLPYADASYGGLSAGTFYLMTTFILFELIIFMVLINAIRMFAKAEKKTIKVAEEKAPVPEVSLLEKLNASVSIEKEQDILMDHDYDGIKELDNDLPPWWKYGFYLTIVFAFIYLVHHHVTYTGDLQLAEYDKSVAKAHEEKEAYQKLMADNVTENNVKMITDKHELEEAGKIYKQNCAACHGQLGEGGVGPNMTDQYWLHGGSIKDIFISIKYGWPDKGMKSWQADLTPSKMNELASYIMTLSGTNPPNQKEKQGELYVAAGMVKDSLVSDSTLVVVPDSVKVEMK